MEFILTKIELYPMIVVINFFFFCHFIPCSVFLCCGMLFISSYANHLMVSKSEDNFALKLSRLGFICAMETWSV